MSRLTHRMKTARSDYYGANCKIWFPANEGSGNIITDKINSLAVTDSGSATYTTANAIGFNPTANGAIAGLANIDIPKQGLLLTVQKVTTSFALTLVSLGNNTAGPGVLVGGTTAALVGLGAACTANMSQTAAAGNIDCVAAAWDLNNLYAYEGINADATLRNTTALPAAVKTALAAGTNFNGQITINQDRSFLYGAVLFDFSVNGLPADLLTQINWMRQRWLVGDKVLPASWKDLT